MGSKLLEGVYIGEYHRRYQGVEGIVGYDSFRGKAEDQQRPSKSSTKEAAVVS